MVEGNKREAGGVEECMLPALEGIALDVRYALRRLARSPAFTLTAIAAAALGIGATTAVFSAVDRILFRPLPYAEEDRLVSVGMLAPLDSNEFLFAEPYFQFRRNRGPFAEVTAFQAGTIATDLTEGNPVRLRALRVEANFLSVFGMRPLVGRMFTREEDLPNGPRVAMISHGLWRSRFGSAVEAVGRTLMLDGAPVEILGVLPPDFMMPTLTQADVLLPLALNESRERAGRALRVFARLKQGVTVRQAVAELEPQFQRALATVPAQFRKEISLRVRPVRDRQVGDVRMASLALLGAVLAVLLIACTNIASLLLARVVARERELTVRAALGASRWRLARHTLTESLVLSAAGGAAGCVLAWVLLRVFVGMAPAGLPRIEEAAIDGRALVCALTAAVVSGLLFGFVPALRTSAPLLVGGWRSTTRTQGGLRWTLVVAQIVICVVLLSGAGLLLRSLWKLESMPLGMETERVLLARFVLGQQHYARGEQQLAFFRELEERMAALPGVEAMAITDSIPPSGGMRGRPLAAIPVEGQPPRAEGTGGMVGWRYVTPGYFAALGIPIVRGRGFLDADRDAGAYAIVLSESLARRLFPNEDPIGKRILKGPQGQWTTVVGVARDVTNLGARRESWPEYYVVRKAVSDFHFENQEPPLGWRSAVVIVRTAIDPNVVSGAIRGVLKSMDPVLPVEMDTMKQRVRDIDERPRFYALLLAAFAVMGVVIAAVGLFGVMSFLVAQRTREIGVRMALGATPAGIVRMTLGPAAGCTAAGAVIGAAVSVVATRLLRSLLFQVEPGDPVAMAAGIGVLCAAVLAAAMLPSLRASRVDPAAALREE